MRIMLLVAIATFLADTSVEANGPDRIHIRSTTVNTSRTVTSVRAPRVSVNVERAGFARSFINRNAVLQNHHRAHRQRVIFRDADYSRGFSGYASAVSYVAPPASYPSTTYETYPASPTYRAPAPGCDTGGYEKGGETYAPEVTYTPAPTPAPTCSYAPPRSHGCCGGSAPTYVPRAPVYAPSYGSEVTYATSYAPGYSYAPEYAVGYAPGYAFHGYSIAYLNRGMGVGHHHYPVARTTGRFFRR